MERLELTRHANPLMRNEMMLKFIEELAEKERERCEIPISI